MTDFAIQKLHNNVCFVSPVHPSYLWYNSYMCDKKKHFTFSGDVCIGRKYIFYIKCLHFFLCVCFLYVILTSSFVHTYFNLLHRWFEAFWCKIKGEKVVFFCDYTLAFDLFCIFTIVSMACALFWRWIDDELTTFCFRLDHFDSMYYWRQNNVMSCYPGLFLTCSWL